VLKKQKMGDCGKQWAKMVTTWVNVGYIIILLLLPLVNKAQKTAENRPTFSHKTKLILGGIPSCYQWRMIAVMWCAICLLFLYLSQVLLLQLDEKALIEVVQVRLSPRVES
jgi:hypothetical protein